MTFKLYILYNSDVGCFCGGTFAAFFLAISDGLCYGEAMKKRIAVIVLLLLCLTLCACGRSEARPIDTGDTNEYLVDVLPVTPEPTVQIYTHFETVAITNENWSTYFEIREIPLYMLNPNGGILEAEQNYCVALREAYLPMLRASDSYQVDFTVDFDVYVNTLDIDLSDYSFSHTADTLFAVRAEHSCVFNQRALHSSDANASYDRFLINGSPNYQNAFFTGSARYTDGVWAGFYVDPSTLQVVSANGTLELGY